MERNAYRIPLRVAANHRSRHNAAVDALRRQVRRHVREPDAFPFVLDLSQILGLIEQFEDSSIRVRGVDVDEASSLAQDKHRRRHAQN